MIFDSLIIPTNNGYSVVLVATQDVGEDWACYMGACRTVDISVKRSFVIGQVAAMGVKLSETQARTWFTNVNKPYRK